MCVCVLDRVNIPTLDGVDVFILELGSEKSDKRDYCHYKPKSGEAKGD